MTIEAGHYVAISGFPPTTAVSVFTHATSSLVSTYTDHSSGTAAANPVTTDTEGVLSFFCVAGDVDLSWSVGGVARTVTVTVHSHPSNVWTGS